MNQPNMTHTPLTQDEATKIAGAYTRFMELRGQAIKTPTADAELAGTVEYLSHALLEHASEFIGCWFAIRNEYEPLIGVLAQVSQRVVGVVASRHAAIAERSQAVQSNVVQLTPA
jgi:hypothetical protein